MTWQSRAGARRAVQAGPYLRIDGDGCVLGEAGVLVERPELFQGIQVTLLKVLQTNCLHDNLNAPNKIFGESQNLYDHSNGTSKPLVKFQKEKDNHTIGSWYVS